MAVIDVIMFRDELDMLEGRLRELDDLVKWHVIVEAPVTHRGEPKPLHYGINRDRFAPWKDKIIHIAVDHDLPLDRGPWATEHAQRDAAIKALDNIAHPDDVVLIADVDEFPPAGFDYDTVRPVVSFRQRLAMYAVDWLYPELHTCTVAARWRRLRNLSLARVRDNRHAYRQHDGGWHLTWLGGLEGQRAKLAVTCHTEMTAHEAELIHSGACYFGGAHHSGKLDMVPADVDDTWPGFIWRRECPESWFRPRTDTGSGLR